MIFVINCFYVNLIFAGVLNTILAIRLFVGDCPIIYEEACDSQLVKFSLDTSFGGNSYQYSLDPFKPILPREFNILTPVKVLIHGYGGLKVDFAIKNVSKAYRDVGYNVITGKYRKTFTLFNITRSFKIIARWNVIFIRYRVF